MKKTVAQIPDNAAPTKVVYRIIKLKTWPGSLPPESFSKPANRLYIGPIKKQVIISGMRPEHAPIKIQNASYKQK